MTMVMMKHTMIGKMRWTTNAVIAWMEQEERSRLGIRMLLYMER